MALDQSKLKEFIVRQRAVFAEARPLCASRSVSNNGFLGNVPQHWMQDWATPFPLVIDRAHGTMIVDVDGNSLTDLCLGDTGAMFGHSPEPITQALTASVQAGLTTMLPSSETQLVGSLLRAHFKMPYWQVTLSASDANRFALRAARAITKRTKVLVFDGCYHGAVDEAGVMLVNGETRPKPSLWGQSYDLASVTVCIPFNDFEAIAQALRQGDIACVLMEPALTNCGIVPPAPGFLEHVRALTQHYGTLLIMDETHTLSTGMGGWCGKFGLEPDFFVAGKAVAGGIPTGIWGFTEDVKKQLDAMRAKHPSGHSGVGTTLAGSSLQMSALKACLSDIMTEATFADMIASASALENAINNIIKERALPWRASFDHRLENALHVGMINRGFLVTPFHNMLLAGPGLPSDTASRYASALTSILSDLS
jgi:glutamate-1-semialdehyde 2,1-aminomutase